MTTSKVRKETSSRLKPEHSPPACLRQSIFPAKELLMDFSTENQFDSEPIHTLQQWQYVMRTFMPIRGELYEKNTSFALPSTAKFHCIPANVVENCLLFFPYTLYFKMFTKYNFRNIFWIALSNRSNSHGQCHLRKVSQHNISLVSNQHIGKKNKNYIHLTAFFEASVRACL